MLFQAQIRERPRKRGIRAVCLQVSYTQSCVFQRPLRGGQVFWPCRQSLRVIPRLHFLVIDYQADEQSAATSWSAGG